MEKTICRDNKKILIAVDASKNALKAVSYVSQTLNGMDGFFFILLHLINLPEADYFSSRSEQEEWIKKYRLKIDGLFEKCRRILVREGFDPNMIALKMRRCGCSSIAECILEEQRRSRCGTLVVGRQGLSRSEEFLFGSVSSKIVSLARNCTVWVVE